MRRREFIGIAGGAAVAWPLVARAQQKAMPVIGYLFSFIPAAGRPLWDACRKGLHELGYLEGKTILLEPRWAEGQGHETLAALAAELVRLKVDVIVSAATPATRAVKAATDTMPIVFVAVSEPVSAGLVASLARPGGNATGLSLLTPELSAKRLELLTDLKKSTRVAALVNPQNLSYVLVLEQTRAAAAKLGIDIVELHASDRSQIERAFRLMKEEHSLDAAIVFDDPVLWSSRANVVALATSLRIPTVYGYRDFVDEGGLISYGPERSDMYRRTAVFVDKILRGARPADLPVEQPTKFELVINLKTAKALGLTVPQSILQRADEVIE